MKLELLFVVIFGVTVLLAYLLIERRINQQACGECGFRVSIDNPDERCPQCGSAVKQYEKNS